MSIRNIVTIEWDTIKIIVNIIRSDIMLLIQCLHDVFLRRLCLFIKYNLNLCNKLHF